MNDNRPTLKELFEQLNARELVNQAEKEKIIERLGETDRASKDPLYIRILAAIGAWMAALFLIAFLVISRILEIGIGSMVCGVVFLAAAVIIARTSKAAFFSQLALALAFSGNILVLSGSVQEFRTYGHLPVVIAQAIICVVVYPLYTNDIYRFLAPTALVLLVTTWIFEEKAFYLMHVLIAAETILAGLLLLHEKRPALLNPLAYSAAAMLPVTLLLMNLTQVHAWRSDFEEPLWPSGILLAFSLIYLFLHLAGGPKRLRDPWMMLAILSTILLGIFTTPGILVAIGLLVVGYAFADRILTGLAYLFLPSFLVVFYYALNIDLAHKSWVVAGSGLILLGVRWIVNRYRTKEVIS